MSDAKDRFSAHAEPSGFAAVPQLWPPDAPSSLKSNRGRIGYCHPATLSLAFAFGGLIWLWLINPIVIARLNPDSAMLSLGLSVPSALMILASAGLLYWVLQARDAANRALCAQNRQLVEFIAHSADPAFLKNQQGCYLAVNGPFAQLAARPASDCLNRDDSALFPPEIAGVFLEHDRQVIAEDTASYRENTFVMHGTLYSLHTTRWPYRDAKGRSVGVCGIAREITAQKPTENPAPGARAEMESRIRERTAALLSINEDLERQIAARIQAEVALRDSQERFRQLAEHIREVFWVYGIDEERLLYISPAYEEIWGYPIDGLYERPMAWIEAIHPDDRARVKIAHIDKRSSGYFHEEYRIVRPDGTIRWIWDRGFPVCDEAGHAYRIAGLAEDITRRKLAEVHALADHVHSATDIAAPVSSGSFRTMGMIVAPCSVRSMAEIAGGVTSGLLSRAADVVLKERRRLVLMVRETPLHTGHLRNMTALSEMGAIIAPPVPAFYARPATLEDMIDHTLGRVLDLFDIDTGDLVRRWKE